MTSGRGLRFLKLRVFNELLRRSQKFTNVYLFRIRNYATTYTENSVYIIGGRHNDYGYNPKNRQMTAIIAQYNNDKWTEVGRLEKPRENHAAITVDGITTVLGGAYLDDQGT